MSKEEFAEYEKEHGPVAGAHSTTAAAGYTQESKESSDSPVISPKTKKD
jgi:hypothetical protein